MAQLVGALSLTLEEGAYNGCLYGNIDRNSGRKDIHCLLCSKLDER